MSKPSSDSHVGLKIDVATPSASKSSHRRGRPREFDPDDAFTQIRICFSRQGYAATSIDDLSDATGLARPSLYRAFGDKRTMFLQALDKEYEELERQLARVKLVVPLSARLSAFYHAACAGYATTGASRSVGVAFGAALADAADDIDVGRRLQKFHSAIEAAALDILGPNVSPTMGPMLAALAISACVKARIGADPFGEVDMAMVMRILTTTS